MLCRQPKRLETQYDKIRKKLIEVFESQSALRLDLLRIILAYMMKRDFLRLIDPSTHKQMKDPRYTLYSDDYLPIFYDSETWKAASHPHVPYSGFIWHLIRFTQLSPDGKLSASTNKKVAATLDETKLEKSANYLLFYLTDDKAYQDVKSLNIVRDLKKAFEKGQGNVDIHSFLNEKDEPICVWLPKRQREGYSGKGQLIKHIALAFYLFAVSHPEMFYTNAFFPITIAAELANLSLEYQSSPNGSIISDNNNRDYTRIHGIPITLFLISDIPRILTFAKKIRDTSSFLVDKGLSNIVACLSLLWTISINNNIRIKLMFRLDESQPKLLSIFKKMLYALPWILPYLFYASNFDYGFYDSDLDSILRFTHRYIAPFPTLVLGGLQLTDEIREYFHLKNPRQEFVVSLMENQDETRWEYLARILENVRRPFYLLCFFMLSLLESNDPGARENIGIALLYALTFLPKMAIPCAIQQGERPYRYLPEVNLFAEQNRFVEADEKDEKKDEVDNENRNQNRPHQKSD